MRLLILWSVLLLGVLAKAEEHLPDAHDSHDSTMGVHGMALFGGADGLFASHLPLFRPPHDRQIVLELAVNDAALQRELRNKLEASGALWTIVPAPFELARLSRGSSAPLASFRADLFEGHFEREGVVRYRDVDVAVRAVLIDGPLDPTPREMDTTTYQPIGGGSTWFLVKQIDARPDFDHIVRVDAPPASAVKAPRRADSAGMEASLVEAAEGAFKVQRTIYFETADLQ